MPMGSRSKRRLAACAVLLAAALSATAPAAAQDWPTRPVTLVVPFAAGGPIDTIARILGAGLSEQLGQQIVVEDQGGAGGMIASARVAKAAPDGYTVLLAGSAVLAQVPAIYKKPTYDAATDFTPVALFADSARILITRTDLPVSTLPEFNAYLKANGAKMQYGSSGVGAGGHVCALLVDSLNATRIAHVPYRGAGPAIQDMIAGRLDYMFEQISTAVGQIEGGNVKAIALMGQDRAAVLPNLPTSAEAGFNGLDCGSWSSLAYPKGVPDAIVRKLAKATDAAVEMPLIRERFAGAGVVVVGKERRSPEYLAKFTVDEIKRWGDALKSAGLKLD